MLLIKGAEVYAPEYLGKKDVLIAGEKIERIGAAAVREASTHRLPRCSFLI